MLRALRWPLGMLIGAIVALGLAFWLDTGSERSRDVALLLGSLAIYLLIPLALLWVLLAAVMYYRRSR